MRREYHNIEMVSQPLSNTDRQVSVRLGQSLTSSLCIQIVSALFYGVFLPVWLYHLRSIILSPNFSKRRLASLTASLIGWLLLTVYFCAKMLVNRLFLNDSLIAYPGMTLAEKLSRTDISLWVPNVVVTSVINLLPILNDTIVVWRAWIIFNKRSISLLLPLCLLAGSYGVAIASIVFLCNGRQTLTTPRTAGILLDTSLPLSIVTNLTATGLVFARYWAHRRSLPPGVRTSAWTLRILTRLIESGALYCVLQIIYLLVGVFGSNHVSGSLGDLAEQIFLHIYLAINGIYPTLVSLIVKNTGDDNTRTVPSNMAGNE